MKLFGGPENIIRIAEIGSWYARTADAKLAAKQPVIHSICLLYTSVANHSSNSITTFKVDYEKNIIMMKGKPRKIETPNCINIWPVPDGEDIEDIEA